MSNDVIIDTLDTLIALVQRNGGVLLPAHRGEAERIARAAWGGERPYIVKTGEVAQQVISARDRAIRRDFQRGCHVPLLARRYSLSERRVQEIVQQERAATAKPGPAEKPAAATVSPLDAADCLTGRAADGESTRSPRTRAARQQGAATAA